MNYQRIYDQIIDRGKVRKLEGYKEKHHIVPKCLGGNNSRSNLVELTAREHFLCHWLLTRIYPTDSKLAYAFWFMSHQKNNSQERFYKVSSRIYAEAVSNLKMTDEHKAKIKKTRVGKKTVINTLTREVKYINPDKLPDYINSGWENTNYKKGLKGVISKEGSKRISEARKREQVGKTGLEAKAAKGPYIVYFESGEKHIAGSYPELSKLTGISYSTLQYRLTKKPGVYERGWKIEKG